MNGQHYRDVLLTQNLLLTSDSNRIFTSFIQQDEASAYRTRESVELLISNTADFIHPSPWPPNNPDLNPVDYTVWVCSRSKSREKIGTVEDMQQRITEEWECLDQRVIDNAVKQWRKPFHACVAANGGHSGHLLIISHNFCFYYHIN